MTKNIIITAAALNQGRKKFPVHTASGMKYFNPRRHHTRISTPSKHRMYIHGNAYTRAICHHDAFRQWQTALNPPPLYIFYCVTGGPCKFGKANAQTKLQLIPYAMFGTERILYPIFPETLPIYAYITQVERQSEDSEWLSVTASVASFSEHPTNFCVPTRYRSRAKEISQNLPLPDLVIERRSTDSMQLLQVATGLRFQDFHMRYRPSKQYDKRYGIIDTMWDRNKRKLELRLPPDLSFLDTPPKHSS